MTRSFRDGQLASRHRLFPVLLGSALCALLVLLIAGSAGGQAFGKKCTSFASQKAAQKFFVGHGGSPEKNVNGLDSDGDGLACPYNKEPYAGYLSIGFNRARSFFYGIQAALYVYAPKTEAQTEAQAQCASGVEPGIVLKKVRPGKDPIVAERKHALLLDPKRLPGGKIAVLTFEWKLELRSAHGSFYAMSTGCYNPRSKTISVH